LQALEAKHMQLLTNYSEDLESVKDAFYYTRDTPVLPKDAARHSGAIKWVRGLVERMEAPMEKIRALSKLVLETEEARRTLAEHTALLQAMKEFEEEHVRAWVSQVSQVRPASHACVWRPCIARIAPREHRPHDVPRSTAAAAADAPVLRRRPPRSSPRSFCSWILTTPPSSTCSR
jgi:hypothetical protein